MHTGASILRELLCVQVPSPFQKKNVMRLPIYALVFALTGSIERSSDHGDGWVLDENLEAKRTEQALQQNPAYNFGEFTMNEPNSPNSPSDSGLVRGQPCCPIAELRQYTLHPGKRDVLIELFDREFIESQEAVGMRIIGQFRDLDNPDRFV
jgi:hypothetical protein